MSNKISLLLVVLVVIVACEQAQPPRPSHPHHLMHPGQISEHQLPCDRTFLHIIGGFEINISDVPYQVSVQYFSRHRCGGSVLNSKWILTSAHCTKGKSVSHFQVRLGSSRHASGGTVVRVLRSVEHPLYNHSTIDYDFSLMELETEFTFSDVVQPVGLPEQDEPVEAGTKAIVSGWRATLNTSETNAVLRAVIVPIVSQDNCRFAYSVKAVTDRMLCAGYQPVGKDVCIKNSGSPLVAEEMLVGVVSWGFGCAHPGLPEVYGRVASVREWVRETSGA